MDQTNLKHSLFDLEKLITLNTEKKLIDLR